MLCCTFRAANKSWHVLLQAGDADIKASSVGPHALVWHRRYLPCLLVSPPLYPLAARPLPGSQSVRLAIARLPVRYLSARLPIYCPLACPLPISHSFIVRLPPVHRPPSTRPPPARPLSTCSLVCIPPTCLSTVCCPSVRSSAHLRVVVSDDVVVTFNTFKTTFFVLSRLSPDCPTYICSNRMQMYS